MSDVAASYVHCQRLARQSASNFYFSFLLLPRDQRRAMCALYAYLRQVDDLGDDVQASGQSARDALDSLRCKLFAGGEDDHTDLILPALRDTAMRFQIPLEYLTAAIDGVEMDLDGTTYATFAELEQYCYRVASVVGLSCLHIWGFRGPEAIEPARQCGFAFQLTNILRDLKEDAERGRVYLPAEDLKRFGYSAEALGRGEVNQGFHDLMRFEIERAKGLFAAAESAEKLIDLPGRRAFRAMWHTYRRLLGRIERDPAAVLKRRVRLNRWEKFGIACRALVGGLARESDATHSAASREAAVR